MSDVLFLDCWSVLNHMGWYDFTWEAIIARYPHWDSAVIAARFPTKHHLIKTFLCTIPPASGHFCSPQEGMFDSVMMRLDALWPFRAVIGPGSLDMPLDIAPSMIGLTAQWFYDYWKTAKPEYTLTNGMPCHVGALSSCALYAGIFPYAMTHGYNETLARLDSWCHHLIAWIEKQVLGPDFLR